jgi:hypothetical protein
MLVTLGAWLGSRDSQLGERAVASKIDNDRKCRRRICPLKEAIKANDPIQKLYLYFSSNRLRSRTSVRIVISMSLVETASAI